ncbi:MAG: SMP-30/gluconolactonase/LRE family protein [Tractidigestivibacter sp.]|jgi:lactonase|uniref:SMP-30/gluconolactonase/LRE family protein n=1 Tax=Tractidigestivibacter sp. TaxID=2847320 RepID=UPI003D93D471
MDGLTYQDDHRGFGIPSQERGVPAVWAERFVDIPSGDGSAEGSILEGLCFDRAGDLYVCNPPRGRIFKVDMRAREVRLFCQLPDHMMPSSIKIDREGMLFSTIVGSDFGSCVAVIDPKDGRVVDTLVRGYGHAFDDMVFTSEGGFYLSMLDGDLCDATAGVLYVEPDHRTTHWVIDGGMRATNGISLSLDERHLLVTEYGTSALHWIALAPDRYTVEPIGCWTPYHFLGYEGPDSTVIDADENLYVSMCGQARFLVLDRDCIAIGQYLIPGRDQRRFNKSTHIAIRPGVAEAYMCAADTTTGEAAIFRAGSFAPAYRSYQFQ